MLKAKPEVFTVSKGPEWCKVILDERDGTLLLHGSFGTWGHNWPSAGLGGTSLKAFLPALDMYYLGKKLLGGDAKVYDHDATMANLRRYIKTVRRQGDVSREQARGAWAGLTYLDYSHSLNWMVHQILELDQITEVVGTDPMDIYDLCLCSPNPAFVQFWQVLWPLVLKEIARRNARWSERLRAYLHERNYRRQHSWQRHA